MESAFVDRDLRKSASFKFRSVVYIFASSSFNVFGLHIVI